MALMEANSINFIQSTLFEPLELEVREFVQPKLSIEEPPKLELKVLPSHLKYVYLGDCSTLLVIISVELTKDQEKQLIVVLKKFKKAIGWTIADIQGRSPSFCMHKIILEEGEKAQIDGKIRLNPIEKGSDQMVRCRNHLSYFK